MFQYTTTTVINSALDSNGVTPKYSGDANAFKVTRVGTFKKDNIQFFLHLDDNLSKVVCI